MLLRSHCWPDPVDHSAVVQIAAQNERRRNNRPETCPHPAMKHTGAYKSCLQPFQSLSFVLIQRTAAAETTRADFECGALHVRTPVCLLLVGALRLWTLEVPHLVHVGVSPAAWVREWLRRVAVLHERVDLSNDRAKTRANIAPRPVPVGTSVIGTYTKDFFESEVLI